MRIVTVRRISQIFFLLIFLWFCITANLGTAWWQLRGWPINWILELDPLTAFATLLTTGTLFSNLLWALVTLILTVFLGRFFCGFACPLGTINQFTGWLGRRSLNPADRIEANRHRPAQALKYYFLVFLLFLAAMGTLQIGIIDPLPLVYRSVNLALLPLVGTALTGVRFYTSVWLLGAIFLTVLGLNLVQPRFFCRYVCPLGAFFGLLGRFSPWRIGKQTEGNCGDCRLCEGHCEGACRPSGTIITGECVLCLNCLDHCPAGRITFAGRPSAAGEVGLPDLSRRGLIISGAGLVMASFWDMGGLSGDNRDPTLIRPPGSLDEDRFLARCLRCGQCMRICPANIIQPALLESGLQGLWSPMINYRLGRSGCQPNCIACGQVCPTAAIRPLTLEEKQGQGNFASQGPIRMGTAFIDRGRCLPWAMDRPCLVCHELCPVSPKAIFTRTVNEIIRDGDGLSAWMFGPEVEVEASLPADINLTGGDYYLGVVDQPEVGLRRILARNGPMLTVEGPPAQSGLAAEKVQVDIVIRLERPIMDPARCIGCGMCEHECPVSGQRAIRVFSENESRAKSGRLLI